MQLVTVAEAASRLQVSPRQVQRLVRSGELHAVGPDRVEAGSVLAHVAARGDRRRRAWSEETAWAAVAMLSAGGPLARWIGPSQRSRLASALALCSPAELVSRTRNRATVHRLVAHRGVLARIAAEIVANGSDQAIGTLTARTTTAVDGYASMDTYVSLTRRWHLDSAVDTPPNVVLRETRFDLAAIAQLAAVDQTLAALDLAGSIDARERAAGLQVLGDRLTALR